MSYTHEFYPMVTGTVKTLVKLTQGNDQGVFMIMLLLCSYPNHERFLSEEEKKQPKGPIYDALVEELDRQYSRWNKGSAK